MRLRRFELEHFISDHEHKARIHLGTSGVATLPLSDLPFQPSEDWLGYGEVPGDPRLARAIAAARGVPADEVLVTVGGTEALFLVPFALVEPGRRVLVESPTYPPLALVPEALGARVERFARTLDGGWRIDVDDVIARLDEDVAYVALTNPNNPTGQLTPARDVVRLAEACERVGAWLLVDDIFRHVVQPLPPVSRTLHPRIVSTDSLTKCHGLSGLRAGWILAPRDLRAQLREAKALTSVVNPAATQALSALALQHESSLVARTLRITHENLARFRDFASRHGLSWREPESPLITTVRLPGGVDDVAHCEALLDEGVLLVPGTHLDVPGHVRLGFGADPTEFADGLAAWGRLLERG